MANNLVHLIKNQLSDNLLGKVASLVGANRSLAGSAMSAFIPRVVRGLVSKGSTLAGAKSIMSLMKDNNMSKVNLGNAFAGGDASKNFMNMGSKLTSSIFGNDQSSVLRNLATETGLSSDAASSMMNIAAPTALHSLSQVVSKGNMSAEDLQSYLKRQNVTEARATDTTTRRETTTTRATQETNTGGGMGWLKWLLPLLLLLGLGWFFTRGGTDTATTDADTTTTEVKETTSASHTHADGTVHHGSHDHGSTTHSHDHSTHDHSHSSGNATATTNNAATSAGYTVDGSGNLVDGDGKVLYNKGDYTVKDGEYYDKDGKKISLIKKIGNAIGGAAGKVGGAVGDAAGAVGDAAGKVGGAVGDAGKAVGGAVAGAAGKTADAFKSVFGGMFSKKEASFGKTYEMSKITFDPASHRITNFSKNEVEGLAQALKSYPDSKIQVQVHGNESTKDRAKVVHDMLVTLGVADKQISFKGMGGDNAAKAAAGKVEIMVEGK